MGPLSGAEDRLASIVGGSRVSGAKAMTSAVLEHLCLET